jgi:hypothetical protein
MAESCTICSSRSKRPVRKLLDTPSYYSAHTRTRVAFNIKRWLSVRWGEVPTTGTRRSSNYHKRWVFELREVITRVINSWLRNQFARNEAICSKGGPFLRFLVGKPVWTSVRKHVEIRGVLWDFFPFATASRPALGPTQPPIRWILVSIHRGKAAGSWIWPLTST